MRSVRLGLVLVGMLVMGATSLQGQRFGVQGSWGDDVDFGVGGRFELDLENALSSEPPFSRTFIIGAFDYFFQDCDPFDCSYWELNGNLAVPFGSADASVDPYAGAGINIARGSVEDFDNTEVGLNLLGGLKFPLGGVSAFGEARIELGGGEQFVITGGILFGGGGS